MLALSSCGKKDASPSHGAASSPAAAAETRDPWPSVAPLIAGTYTGGCMRVPQMDTVDARIVLGLDGKVTAPDTSFDVRKAQLITLTRETAASGARAGAMLSMDAEKGPILNLLDTGKPDGAGAALIAGDKQLSCPKGAPLDKLRSQPLHKALAQLVESPERSIKCVDVATKMSWKDTPFKLAGGVLTLGNETFDLNHADLETLMIVASEDQVTYAARMPNGPMLHVSYTLAGKLIAIQGQAGKGLSHACQREV